MSSCLWVGCPTEPIAFWCEKHTEEMRSMLARQEGMRRVTNEEGLSRHLAALALVEAVLTDDKAALAALLPTTASEAHWMVLGLTQIAAMTLRNWVPGQESEAIADLREKWLAAGPGTDPEEPS